MDPATHSTLSRPELTRVLEITRDGVLAAGAVITATMLWMGRPQGALVIVVAAWLFGAALHQAGLALTGSTGRPADWAVIRWRRFRWPLALACLALSLNIMFATDPPAVTLAAQAIVIVGALLAFELVPVFGLVWLAMSFWGLTGAALTGTAIAVAVGAFWAYRRMRSRR